MEKFFTKCIKYLQIKEFGIKLSEASKKPGKKFATRVSVGRVFIH